MNTDKLIKLYKNTSKHSNYQILPSCIKGLIDDSNLNINSRFEEERLNFLKENIEFLNNRIVDIGGNTGFFTFESLDLGSDKVYYFEGNKSHAEFVEYIANDFSLNVNVDNKYLNFIDDIFPKDIEITLLFNVLHHLGDDFGDVSISMKKAKENIAKSVNYFANKTSILVLQIGFCWKGNVNLPLFESGTKKEMIDFVNEISENHWEIKAIGIAEALNNGKTQYCLLNEENIERDDSLGEFRNRPIFILKSKKNT